MRNIAKYLIGAFIALSASAAVAAPTATQSDSSCHDRYGYYGYSWAYCEHDIYGRSSPADRYDGQDRDLISQAVQQLGREPETNQYSYLYRGLAGPDRRDNRHLPDRDRDVG